MSGLSVIKRLQSSSVSQEELEEIQRRHRDDIRVMAALVQHPKFPQAAALGILNRLFAVDLLRVIKNVKANPYVRKKAELEFLQRYKRLALGEKASLLKMAPNPVLLALHDETHPRLIEAILRNPGCSEEVVLRFVNLAADRGPFYQVLAETSWFQGPAVAEAIAHDPEAPIRMLLLVVPHLGLAGLQRLTRQENLHQAVKDRIRRHLEERK